MWPSCSLLLPPLLQRTIRETHLCLHSMCTLVKLHVYMSLRVGQIVWSSIFQVLATMLLCNTVELYVQTYVKFDWRYLFVYVIRNHSPIHVDIYLVSNLRCGLVWWTSIFQVLATMLLYIHWHHVWCKIDCLNLVKYADSVEFGRLFWLLQRSLASNLLTY
jgi:hypothetical protein